MSILDGQVHIFGFANNRKAPQNTNAMPKSELAQKIESQKADLTNEIAEMYPQLTGQERMDVASAIHQSLDTLGRYADPEHGVKKLATGILMRDKMREVIEGRQSTKAA